MEGITEGKVPGAVHPTRELEQLVSKSKEGRRPHPPILRVTIEAALKFVLGRFGTIAQSQLVTFPTSEFVRRIGKGERYSLLRRIRLRPSVRACGKGAARPRYIFPINLRVTQFGPA